VVSQKDIALLRTKYYRLSRENRAIILARAEEFVAREPPLPEREGRETTGPEQGVAVDGKPGGAE
jgi:hypothetical protein